MTYVPAQVPPNPGGGSVAGGEGYYGQLGMITGGQGVGASSENTASGTGWSGQGSRPPVGAGPSGSLVYITGSIGDTTVANPIRYIPTIGVVVTYLANCVVKLEATSSVAFLPTTWNWNVNGITSTTQVAYFTLEPGTHTASLRASSPYFQNTNVYVTKELVVTRFDNIAGYLYEQQGSLFAFTWNGNYDPGDQNIKWDMGDGSPFLYGRTVSYTYPARGGFTVTVSASGYQFSGPVLVDVAVHLTWSDNSSGETGFYVYYSYDNVTWTKIQTLPANTTSTDVGVSDGVDTTRTVYYKVTAYGGGGESTGTTTSIACPG